MSRRMISCALLLFLVFSPIFAQVEQIVIPLSSSLYEDVDTLYLLTELPTASQSRPWGENEARMIVDAIDDSCLNEQGKRIYQDIEKILNDKPQWQLDERFSLGLHLDVNLQAYLHTNTSFSNYTDWIYSYTDRPPLLRARLDMAMKNYFYLYIDGQFGYGLATSKDLQSTFYTVDSSTTIGSYNAEDFPDFIGTITPNQASNGLVQYKPVFASNLILSPNDWEYNWPKRAVFSVGGDSWNLNVSRDRLSWGNSHIGNFIFDNHLDYLDYLRFDTFSPKFKFESLFVFLTPYPNQTTGSSEQIDTGVRIFMAHRFEFVIFNVLKLSLDEGLMYYNKNGSLNLAYLNPSSLYHNLSDRNLFNAIASLELDYSFAPRWKAYLQFCIDQAKSTNEEENNAEPNAMGISGGLSFVNTVGKGTYTTNLEGAVTSPALYRRDKVDFVIAQRHIRFTNDLTEKAFYYVYDYLGFPYGGDAVVLQWENSFRRDSWQIEADFVSVLHGDTSMFTDLTTVNASTLLGSNTLYWTNVGTLKGSYEWENLHLTGTCEMDVIGKAEYDKSNRSFDSWSWDTQFVLGVKYVL